jgi:hypothetical protein
MCLWTSGPPLGTIWTRRKRSFKFKKGSGYSSQHPLPMRCGESYAKAFPFVKVVNGMLDPEMIEDTEKIVNEDI